MVEAQHIINVLYNSLRYQEFITFWNNLTLHERNDVEIEIDNLLTEQHTCGFDEGHSEGYLTASEEIVKQLKENTREIQKRWIDLINES